VLTRAERDGDVYILNGSKIWSSGAAESDYAMCLARTNWDVPKHRGLTMFIMKIHQPGVQVEQIRQVDGSLEFCQEFFDDVAIPAADVVGEVDDGWTGGHPAPRARAQRRWRRLALPQWAARGATRPAVPTTASRGRPHHGRRRIPHVRQLVAEATVRQLGRPPPRPTA
jgi:alkylation response protein AidB-like acyl-CoA dehydrogenase